MLATALVCMATSCTNSSHLLVYQHSNLGMSTGINPANQSVHVRIGVRNQVVAIVPKYAIEPEDGRKKKFEAASAYFATRFRINSIWEVPEAAEVLATGNAAVLVASKGKLKLKEGHDDVNTGLFSSTEPHASHVNPNSTHEEEEVLAGNQ